MKKFKFRLDVLIDIRRRREEKITLELAEQNRLVIKEQDKILHLHKELETMQETEKNKRSTENSIIALRYTVAYRHKLKSEMLKIGKKIDELHENMIRIQKKLIVASRDKKAVEIIKEHKYSEWHKKYKEQEQEFIDDIAQKKHFKRQVKL